MFQDRGFWYVGFLGVDPDCQGQGIGSILLQYVPSDLWSTPKPRLLALMHSSARRSVIDKADKEDMQVYLETANERNVPWYEKFGFVVIYKEKAGFVGPMVWYLRRCGTMPCVMIRRHRTSLLADRLSTSTGRLRAWMQRRRCSSPLKRRRGSMTSTHPSSGAFLWLSPSWSDCSWCTSTSFD